MMSDAYQMGLSTGAGLGTLAQNLQQSNQVLLPALLQHQMQARLAQAQLAQAQAQMKETSAYHTGMLNQRAQELDQKKIDSENMKAYRDAMVEQSKQAKLNNLMTLQANTMQKQQALEQQRAVIFIR